MEKVVFTTGGTGGHIYPALSIAKKVREKGIDTLFVGTKHRMEKDIVPNAIIFVGFSFFSSFYCTCRCRYHLNPDLYFLKAIHPAQ